MTVRAAFALLALLIATGVPSAAEKPVRGIAGILAPGWEVDQWVNLPEGKRSLDLADYKGKVVYLYCFQSWCPGCHSSGFPTLKALHEKFADDPGIAFVAVQTVFEGFATNTPEKAASTAERYGLEIPFGHSGKSGDPSPLMRAYRTGGTPWTIVIDKKGVVRFNDFHLSPAEGAKLLRSLAAAG